MMKRVIAFSLGLVLLAALSGCGAGAESDAAIAEKYMEAALEYMDNQDYDTAATILEEGIGVTGDPSLEKLLGAVEAMRGAVQAQEAEPPAASSEPVGGGGLPADEQEQAYAEAAPELSGGAAEPSSENGAVTVSGQNMKEFIEVIQGVILEYTVDYEGRPCESLQECFFADCCMCCMRRWIAVLPRWRMMISAILSRK